MTPYHFFYFAFLEPKFSWQTNMAFTKQKGKFSVESCAKEPKVELNWSLQVQGRHLVSPQMCWPRPMTRVGAANQSEQNRRREKGEWFKFRLGFRTLEFFFFFFFPSFLQNLDFVGIKAQITYWALGLVWEHGLIRGQINSSGWFKFIVPWVGY